MKYLKTCPGCMREFETENDRKVWCSIKCRDRARYKPKEHAAKECAVCGNCFVPKQNAERYCSDACREIGRSFKKEPFEQQLVELRLCPVCGGEIPPPSANNIERKYCSRKCGKKANRDKSLLLPEAKKPKHKSIAEIAAEAKAAGMTYGEYVVKMRG